MQSSEISRALESWYSRHRGGDLCDSIRERLNPILGLAFGYHILQLGPLPDIGLVDSSPINHRIFASTGRAGGGASSASLYCHGDELPLECDSIDMLVAFHALEFDEHPHASLREMQRVLRPHGHLVIIAFNPFSLLGVGHYLRRLMRRGGLWQHHHPVSPQRLSDWLKLLHCPVESIQHLHPLPFAGQGGLRTAVNRIDAWAGRHNLPGGGVYIAHAIKQIGAVRRPTPLTFETPKRLVGLAVAGRPSPTPRQPRGGQDLAA